LKIGDFALQYLFQAHPVNVIGRYPRYRELWDRFRSAGESPERVEKLFQPQDFTDLQVLSQIAWFDEYFLQEKNIAELVSKGNNYSLEDQRFVIAMERELIGRVVPVHAEAAQEGSIEISTSPFYHPSCRWCATRKSARFHRPGCRCRRTAFAIPRMHESSCCGASTFTRKCLDGVRPASGPRRGASRRKFWLLPTAWEFNGWQPTKASWVERSAPTFPRWAGPPQCRTRTLPLYHSSL